MTINEWLRRLNLHQYTHNFKSKGKIHLVNDLKYLDEGDLTEYGLKLITERRRLMNMLRGDQETKQNFLM